ncbi:alkaline-phosphatase-like protein [Lineolata rhizophorae]|uniref:Alkaline-phosphatase-like protein n=1 Tax=Lineolata rhizophorae TaxID=578093 RepID=A0A6A6NL86_9PEZI|nr:alkaline-phosphatase-like protein [Lineolata rhizophorae]
MAPRSVEKDGLLARSSYDADAASLPSTPTSPTSNDDVASAGRPSEELASHDRELLDEEEERERLLTGAQSRSVRQGIQALFARAGPGGAGNDASARERTGSRREKRSARRKEARRKRRGGEEGELMYEMEEGGRRSESEASSERDQHRLGTVMAAKKTRRSRIIRLLLHGSILVLFLILVYLGAVLSKSRKQSYASVFESQTLRSNGSSLFAPTTILISLDGFRADFLARDLTPTLNAFIRAGVSPPYMLPSFPSVTFPNHYTLATGLYPEAHGIVGNSFWDEELAAEFYYTNKSHSMQPHWWADGEPVWVTAENAGVPAAIHMWPGSEAHIAGVEPAHLDRYNGSEVLSRKVDRIMQFLDLPGPDQPGASRTAPRPQLIAAYVPDVDSDGHKYGPNSTEIRTTIANADNMLADVFQGLEARNLTDVVNVVVVSDHGMATTDVSRLLQFEDLLDGDEEAKKVSHIDGWPLYGLRLHEEANLRPMYEALKRKAADDPAFDVYLRDEDMPERYHFSNNERIAPLWIVPKTGWAIVTRDEFDVEEGRRAGAVYHPRGLHGYDHEHPLMRAIFIARGPAFPHTPGSRLDVFQNTQVYNIICDSLGIAPHPNNGTLRLPLRPVGTHFDDAAPPVEIPHDPVVSAGPPSVIPLPPKPEEAPPVVATTPLVNPIRPGATAAAAGTTAAQPSQAEASKAGQEAQETVPAPTQTGSSVSGEPPGGPGAVSSSDQGHDDFAADDDEDDSSSSSDEEEGEEGEEEDEEEEEEEEEPSGWQELWQWVHDKVEAMKDWAHGMNGSNGDGSG